MNVILTASNNFSWSFSDFSPLGKRLGIATVLGYLFTGILLGPSVLNIAHDPEAIMELAEFGVILLMFLIGLELRPNVYGKCVTLFCNGKSASPH